MKRNCSFLILILQNEDKINTPYVSPSNMIVLESYELATKSRISEYLENQYKWQQRSVQG